MTRTCDEHGVALVHDVSTRTGRVRRICPTCDRDAFDAVTRQHGAAAGSP